MPLRLNHANHARIGPFVSIRTLLSALLALAVLLSPAVATAAATRIAVPDHQIQMMEAGHCKSLPSSDHEKSDNKSCCVSLCIGLAVSPSAPLTETVSRPSPPVFAVESLHLAYLGEIATPPPRHI